MISPVRIVRDTVLEDCSACAKHQINESGSVLYIANMGFVSDQYWNELDSKWILGVQFSSIQSPLNRKGRYKGCQSESSLDKSIFLILYWFQRVEYLCFSVGDSKQDFISIIIRLKFRSTEVSSKLGHYFDLFLK